MLRVKNKYYVNLLDLNHKTGKKLSLYLYIYGMISKNVLLSLLQYIICRIVLQYGNILYSGADPETLLRKGTVIDFLK